jgi:hypothetical protein
MITVFTDVMLCSLKIHTIVLEEPIYQTTRHHIPGDSNLYGHCCEVLRPHKHIVGYNKSCHYLTQLSDTMS